MTSEEKMREEYEKFTGKSWHCHLDMTNRIIWENAWKASRESLVIELRKIEFDDDINKDTWTGIRSTLRDCRESIHAAGVKTR